MYKLFLFVAFLAFAAAAPGSLLSPILPYSSAIYSAGYAAPYAYSAYSAPALTYNYNQIGPYPYRPAYYAL